MQGQPADSAADGPPRALLIAALALALATIGAVLGIAARRHTAPAPVVIASVPAPQADGPECRALVATLPGRLGDFGRADTAQPTPAGAAAWRRDGAAADDVVILRCGVDRPDEFVVGAPVQMVDDVGWFRLADTGSALVTWLCVDRPAYVALTLPEGSGPAPIQAISGIIDRTMPAMPIRPGPA